MSNQQETPYSIKYPFMVFMSQLFFAMMTMIQMQYQNAFMTDLARLPFLWIGTIASICNIVSTVFVFIQPFILQVVDFRIGKYRGWMIYFPFIYSALLVIAYFNKSTPLATAVVFTICNCIACVLLNFTDTAQALFSFKIAGTNDRIKNSVSINKGRGAYANSILFGFIGNPMIALGTALFGYENYLAAMFIIVGILTCIFYWIYAFSCAKFEPARTKEQFKLDKEEAKKNPAKAVTIKDMLKAIGQNPPLLWMVIGEFFRYTGQFGFTMMMFYYFKCTLDWVAGVAIYSTIRGLGNVVGTYMVPVLCKIFPDRKKVYLLGCLSWVIFPTILFLTPLHQSFISFAIGIFIAAFFGGGPNTLYAAMFSDCGTYAQWKTGKDMSGLIVGTYLIPNILSNFLRGVYIPAGLSMLKYNPDEGYLLISKGIAFMTLELPAIWYAIAFVIILLGFPKKEKFDKWYQEIQERKAAAVVAD